MTVQLGSCAPFDRLVVQTRSSRYEVVVLCGRTGEVLIRGGRYFPEFRPALLTGCGEQSGALKPRTIGVGHCMKVRDGLKFYTTTPVEAIAV